jgi:hypothetical protein
MGVRKHSFRRRNHTSHCNCSWDWTCSQYILGIPCSSWVPSTCYMCSPSLCLFHSNTCDWWLLIKSGSWLYFWGCQVEISKLGYKMSLNHSIWQQPMLGHFLEDPGPREQPKLVNRLHSKYRWGAGAVRTSPGQALIPVTVPGQNTWGRFVSPLFKHTRAPKPRSCPETTGSFTGWSYHQVEEQPQGLHALWGSCETRQGPMAQAWAFSLNLGLLCLGKFLECRCGKFRARPPSLSPRECFTFHYLQQLGTHNSGALLPPVLFSSFQANRNLSGAECNVLKGTDTLGMC